MNKCTNLDCDETLYAMGYCAIHYRKALKNGTINKRRIQKLRINLANQVWELDELRKRFKNWYKLSAIKRMSFSAYMSNTVDTMPYHHKINQIEKTIKNIKKYE